MLKAEKLNKSYFLVTFMQEICHNFFALVWYNNFGIKHQTEKPKAIVEQLTQCLSDDMINKIDVRDTCSMVLV